jgi:hypothetical protein
MRSLLAIPLFATASLSMAPEAQAQAAAQIRADFHADGVHRGVVSAVIGTDETLSVFCQPEPGLGAEMRSLELVVAETVLEVVATPNNTFEVVLPLTDRVGRAIRSGEGIARSTWSDGVLVSPLGDIGFAPYGSSSGSSYPSQFPLALHGVGHAVAGAPVSYVGKGLEPGTVCVLGFSLSAGSGEWAPGVSRWIGDVVHSVPFTIGTAGELQWPEVLSTAYPTGLTVYSQVVGIRADGTMYATQGLRMEIKPPSSLVWSLQSGGVSVRMNSGYLLSSATLNADGLADFATQKFLDLGPNDPDSTGNAGLIGHPALTVAAGLIAEFGEQGSGVLEPAVEEQLSFISANVEFSGAWDTCWHSDGCTLPWKIQQPKWVDCCDDHDICYCIGGTEADRLACDEDFYDCVLFRTGNKNAAKMVYDAVRTHGERYFHYVN